MRKARGGTNLTYSLVETLGQSIVSGEFTAENRFPTEAELSQIHGASHSITREAVKMLTAKGLLVSRPRLGTQVQPEAQWNMLDPDVLGWLLERKFSPSLLMEFNEIRLAVEPGAAELAARVATEADKTAIQAAIVRMQAAENGDDDPLDSDIAFHVSVLRASRNRFYSQLTGFIATALGFSIRMTNRNKGVKLASSADHKKVADAIIAGRPAAAHDAMRKLIREAMDLINWREEPQRARRLAGNGSS